MPANLANRFHFATNDCLYLSYLTDKLSFFKPSVAFSFFFCYQSKTLCLNIGGTYHVSPLTARHICSSRTFLIMHGYNINNFVIKVYDSVFLYCFTWIYWNNAVIQCFTSGIFKCTVSFSCYYSQEPMEGSRKIYIKWKKKTISCETWCYLNWILAG